MTTAKLLRQAMPRVTEFLDALRDDPVLRPQINAAIRSGLDGQPTFWAKEAGIEVGTRQTLDTDRLVTLSKMDLSTNRTPRQNNG